MRAACFTLLTLALVALAPTPRAAGQGLLDGLDTPADAAPRETDEYTQQVGRLTPMQIIQQKAQARAAQRMNRMAALEWYGHSVARPRTTATPFTGLYGAQFQGRSYGRPAAHYATRPIVVVTK